MKQKDITISQFNKELIKLFAKNTSCSAQYNNCPCNTCFHYQEADFKHICWLIALAIRGDYNKQEILKAIQEELWD
jgi:hypothetical protein